MSGIREFPQELPNVEVLANLIDDLARCHSENAMDRAFLDNSGEIAEAVLKLIADRDGEWACTVNRLEDEIASLNQRVAVKPLVWTNASPPSWHAVCPISRKGYIIDREEGKWWACWNVDLPGFDDLDEAKAAAQSDYESRIRSALENSKARLADANQNKEPSP